MKKLDDKQPILVARKPRTIHACPQCGQNLIRGFGVSVCGNPVCDSLPENIAPEAFLEAWVGL